MKTVQKHHNKFFELMQLLSQAFMTPIAIMPLAGILLGVGAALQTGFLVEQLPWLTTGIWPMVASVIREAGNVVFGNLGLLFAIGIAMGMCNNDGIAGLSGAIGYLVMNKIIGVVGGIDAEMMALAVNRGKYTTVLGMPTLQMGVFSGILVGILTAYIFKKFHKTKLPTFIEFFQGKRLVMIITSVFAIILGLVLLLVWPYFQTGLTWISTNVVESNPAIATFLYGLVSRALIPLGLHHVWNVPFYYMFGNYTNLAGELISGDYNIYFAQLADGVSITAGSFCGGGAYVLKMFALPGAALAMYKCADPSKRKKTAGLLFSIAFTAFLTGVTEPLEFTILFAALPLYGFYVVTSGLAFLLCYLLNIKVALTFAGGLIDFILLGVLQDAPNWLLTIPLGIVFFISYYFVFKYLIIKFNFITPGREVDDDFELTEMPKDAILEEQIIKALGGAANIQTLGACATRLRVTVQDETIVQKKMFTSSLGASGVMQVANNYQIVYGPKAQLLCDNIKEVMANRPIASVESTSVNKDKKKSLTLEIKSPCEGKLIALKDVPDPAFSSKMIGEGFAIDPTNGIVCAPFDGVVQMVFPTLHAIGLTSETNIQVLIHIGLDTVNLAGEGYTLLVNENDKVKVGDPLITFDVKQIKEKGYNMITPIVFPELTQYNVKVLANDDLRIGDKIELDFNLKD